MQGQDDAGMGLLHGCMGVLACDGVATWGYHDGRLLDLDGAINGDMIVAISCNGWRYIARQ